MGPVGNAKYGLANAPYIARFLATATISYPGPKFFGDVSCRHPTKSAAKKKENDTTLRRRTSGCRYPLRLFFIEYLLC